MITATDIAVSFGEVPLYENVSMRLVAGNVYGFIGANGCGKSTFIKAWPAISSPMLAQLPSIPVRAWASYGKPIWFEDQRVLDVVLQGQKVWDLQSQMDALYAKEDFPMKTAIPWQKSSALTSSMATAKNPTPPKC